MGEAGDLIGSYYTNVQTGRQDGGLDYGDNGRSGANYLLNYLF